MNVKPRQMLAETYTFRRRLDEGVSYHLSLLEDAFNSTTAATWRKAGEKAPPPKALAFQLTYNPLLALVQAGNLPKALEIAGRVLGWDGVHGPADVAQSLQVRQYLVDIGELPASALQAVAAHTEGEGQGQGQGQAQRLYWEEDDPGMAAAMAKDARENLRITEAVLPLIHLRLQNFEAALQGFSRLWLTNVRSVMALGLLQATVRNLCRVASADCDAQLALPLRDLNPFRPPQQLHALYDGVAQSLGLLKRDGGAEASRANNGRELGGAPTLRDVVSAATAAYAGIVARATNEYSNFDFRDVPLRDPKEAAAAVSEDAFRAGFRPVRRLSTWTPPILSSMPSVVQFARYIRQRQPFIVRVDPTNRTHYFDSFEGCQGLGDCQDSSSSSGGGSSTGDSGTDGPSRPSSGYNVSPCGEQTFESLGWDVCKWDAAYLCKLAGNERAALATSVAGSHGVFAVGTHARTATHHHHHFLQACTSPTSASIYVPADAFASSCGLCVFSPTIHNSQIHKFTIHNCCCAFR